MVRKSRLSPSAQEWINHFSDAELEQMRNSVSSKQIEELMAEGLLEREAIWLASCRAVMVEVGPDDPIYNDQSFNFSYRMPSGRMEPLELQLTEELSSDSEPLIEIRRAKHYQGVE